MKKHSVILLRILGYYGAYFLLANLGILAIILVFRSFGSTQDSSLTGEFMSDVLLLPMLILVFHLFRKEKRSELFQEKIQWRKVLNLVPISIAARLVVVLAMVVLAAVLLLFLGQDVSQLIDQGIAFQWSAFDKAQGFEKVFGFFSFAVFGPINEELLNRAVILTYLRTQYSVKASIIYSSIIFMFAHIHPGLYLSSFVLGLVLAYVYIKGKNIWYPVILHILINLQPFLFAYFIDKI